MSSKKRISSGSPFEKSIGFSRAVRVGDHIFVAGTAPIAEDGSPAFPGDAYLQTKYCLQIIQKAIEEAGGRLEDVVRTRVFLTDVTKWEEAGKAHGEFFRDIRPAATMLEVSRLINPEWYVEIEADCLVLNSDTPS